MKKYTVVIKGKTFEVEILNIESGKAKVMVDGVEINADILEGKGGMEILDESIDQKIVEKEMKEDSFVPASHPESEDSDGIIKAMMPGKIISVKVSEGDHVKQGDLVCVMESMKMEQNILSAVHGKVLEVNVKSGDTVEHNAVLIKVG